VRSVLRAARRPLIDHASNWTYHAIRDLGLRGRGTYTPRSPWLAGGSPRRLTASTPPARLTPPSDRCDDRTLWAVVSCAIELAWTRTEKRDDCSFSPEMTELISQHLSKHDHQKFFKNPPKSHSYAPKTSVAECDLKDTHTTASSAELPEVCVY